MHHGCVFFLDESIIARLFYNRVNASVFLVLSLLWSSSYPSWCRRVLSFWRCPASSKLFNLTNSSTRGRQSILFSRRSRHRYSRWNGRDIRNIKKYISRIITRYRTASVACNLLVRLFYFILIAFLCMDTLGCLITFAICHKNFEARGPLSQVWRAYHYGINVHGHEGMFQLLIWRLHDELWDVQKRLKPSGQRFLKQGGLFRHFLRPFGNR